MRKSCLLSWLMLMLLMSISFVYGQFASGLGIGGTCE